MITAKIKLITLMFLYFHLVVTKVVVALTPQEIAKKAYQSTVVLFTDVGQGSGFFIANDMIVTNHHVIQGSSNAEAYLVGNSKKITVLGYVALDEERDLAILKVKRSTNQPIDFSDSNGVQVGDSVYAIGSPKGLEGTFTQGIVSRIVKDGYIQISAGTAPGSSGGPILNIHGEVVAVHKGKVPGGENMNLSIPVNEVKILLENIHKYKPLSSIVWPDKLRSDNYTNSTPKTDAENFPKIIKVLPSGSWIIDLSKYADLGGYHTLGPYSNPFKFYGALVANKLKCKHFYESYTLRTEKRFAAYICLDDEVKSKDNIAHYKTDDIIALYNSSNFLPLIGIDEL